MIKVYSGIYLTQGQFASGGATPCLLPRRRPEAQFAASRHTDLTVASMGPDSAADTVMQGLKSMQDVFAGSLAGDGVVKGLLGQAVDTFRIEYFGQWSMGDDAFHLDETVTYGDGRQRRRNWTIQIDKHGHLVGYDAQRQGRMRAERRQDGVRMVLDHPLGAGAELAGPRTVMELTEASDGSLRLSCRAAVLGLPYRRSTAVLRRQEKAAA